MCIRDRSISDSIVSETGKGGFASFRMFFAISVLFPGSVFLYINESDTDQKIAQNNPKVCKKPDRFSKAQRFGLGYNGLSG